MDTKKTDAARLQGKYKIREDLEKEIDALMKSKTKTAEVTAESKGEDKVQTLEDKLKAMQSIIAEVDRQSNIWDSKGRGNFPVISEQKKSEWNNEIIKTQNELDKSKFEAGQKQLNYDEDMISKRMEIEKAGEMQRLLLKEDYLRRELALASYYNQAEKEEELRHQLHLNQLDKEATAKKMLERSKQLQYELELSKADRTKNDQEKDTVSENKNYDDEKKKIQEDPLLTENQKKLALEELEKAHQQRLLDIKHKFYDAWLGELLGLSKKEIEDTEKIQSKVEEVFNSLMNMQSKSAQEAADNYRTTETDKLDTQKKSTLAMARTDQQRQAIEEDYTAQKKKIDDDANKQGQDRIKTAYAIQKAAGIASAMISTYKGATAALEPPPIGAGPILGPILMAVTIAAGLAQVATISQQEMPKFAMGGMPSMAFIYRPQGLINGPGSGTSDSILARISNKEFIVNAEATAKHRLLLENLNIGRFNNGGFAGGSSYSSSHISNIDTGATEELRSLRNDMKELTSGLNNALDAIAGIAAKPAAIGDRECAKVTRIGIARMKKAGL